MTSLITTTVTMIYFLFYTIFSHAIYRAILLTGLNGDVLTNQVTMAEHQSSYEGKCDDGKPSI